MIPQANNDMDSSTSDKNYGVSNNRNNSPTHEKILWSSISRNGTILVEAGADPFDGAVTETARGILSKKNTAGWEFFTQSRKLRKTACPRLKAVKFHIYEHHGRDHETSEWDCHPLVWVYAAVYNPEAETWENRKDSLQDVQAFVQKIIGLSDMMRLSDRLWREGPLLACQSSFEPTLSQRMREVTYLGKMARLNQCIQDTTKLMHANITAILESQARFDYLEHKGEKMQEMAVSFKKANNVVKRRMMMQNAKHGLVLGTAITAGVAVIVGPPLIALL